MDVDVAAVYEVTARPAMPGAVAALFVDRPDSVESVNDAMVDAWGIPPDRLFSLAEQNTRRLESASHSTMYSPEGVEIHVLYGPSLFTASHALWPTDWLTDSLRPEVGVLLACPTRHVVLAHVVAGRSVLQAIPTLSALTAQRYADGPGSLFRSLWWWRDGIAHPVRIDPSGRVIVDAEDPLTEWLNQLTAGETQ